MSDDDFDHNACRPSVLYGRIVSGARLNDESDELHIDFEDGGQYRIIDQQSCCEHRYMVCDDDLTDLVGGGILLIETRSAPDVEIDDETHETMFLEIQTRTASVNIATHNEHNGYYGGFSLRIVEDAPAVNPSLPPVDGIMPNKLTLDDIEALVRSEDFIDMVAGSTMTICVLTLANGAVVIGESACIDMKNYLMATGRKVARANAIAKIWELEGYLVRQRLHEVLR